MLIRSKYLINKKNYSKQRTLRYFKKFISKLIFPQFFHHSNFIPNQLYVLSIYTFLSFWKLLNCVLNTSNLMLSEIDLWEPAFPQYSLHLIEFMKVTNQNDLSQYTLPFVNYYCCAWKFKFLSGMQKYNAGLIIQ